MILKKQDTNRKMKNIYWSLKKKQVTMKPILHPNKPAGLTDVQKVFLCHLLPACWRLTLRFGIGQVSRPDIIYCSYKRYIKVRSTTIFL